MYQNVAKKLPLVTGLLKMGPIGRPETSVRNYHYTLRNNPKERGSLLVSRFQIRVGSAVSVVSVVSAVSGAKHSSVVCQTPGNYPEESIQHSEHGESLKSRIH